MPLVSKEMSYFISAHKRWKIAHTAFVENYNWPIYPTMPICLASAVSFLYYFSGSLYEDDSGYVIITV